jgi:hypothetical protein
MNSTVGSGRSGRSNNDKSSSFGVSGSLSPSSGHVGTLGPMKRNPTPLYTLAMAIVIPKGVSRRTELATTSCCAGEGRLSAGKIESSPAIPAVMFCVSDGLFQGVTSTDNVRDLGNCSTIGRGRRVEVRVNVAISRFCLSAESSQPLGNERGLTGNVHLGCSFRDVPDIFPKVDDNTLAGGSIDNALFASVEITNHQDASLVLSVLPHLLDNVVQQVPVNNHNAGSRVIRGQQCRSEKRWRGKDDQGRDAGELKEEQREGGRGRRGDEGEDGGIIGELGEESSETPRKEVEDFSKRLVGQL